MRHSAMPETLRIERNEHVVSVVLEKPTMPPLFFDELGAAFDEISADADVRAVIVRSDT